MARRTAKKRIAKVKAVILAGGKGTRLRPYTHVFPKPLMPIGNRPILEIVLSQLANAGVGEAILAVEHEAKKLYSMVLGLQDYGIKIRFQGEPKPLGTAGPLKFIRGLGDDFLVLNGDILTDLNFKKLLAFHHKKNAIATIASIERKLPIDFGVMDTDGHLVTDYTEKPTVKHLVSMGIYAFNRRVLEYIPRSRHFDFPSLVKRLIAADQPPVVYKHTGKWLDIGREADYENAVREFFKNSKRFLGNGVKSFNRRGR